MILFSKDITKFIYRNEKGVKEASCQSVDKIKIVNSVQICHKAIAIFFTVNNVNSYGFLNKYRIIEETSPIVKCEDYISQGFFKDTYIVRVNKTIQTFDVTSNDFAVHNNTLDAMDPQSELIKELNLIGK